MQNLCKHRQYQQDVFPCPICDWLVRIVDASASGSLSVPLCIFLYLSVNHQSVNDYRVIVARVGATPLPPSLYECA